MSLEPTTRIPDLRHPGDVEAATAILRALTADQVEPLQCCRADGDACCTSERHSPETTMWF